MTDNELKELVASLAVHSRETDRLITRLSEESRREAEESRRDLEAWREKSELEIEARRKEWNQELEARREKSERELEAWRKEWDKKHAELWAELKETDRIVRENGKQLGTMSENEGMHAEQYFQHILNKKLEFGGMKYDALFPNLECFDENRIPIMEFDIVLVNGNSVAIIEAKSSIRSEFIWKLVKDRLPVFRKSYPMFSGHKAYLGIAGFSFSKKVLEQAEKYGVGIIRQVGDSVEMKTDNLKAY